MKTCTLELRVFCDDARGFGDVRNSNVLLYWPHGLGDFVFLSTILPLLDSTNKYFIVRFGDDNTALFEGCGLLSPLYLGFDNIACDHGSLFGSRHLGLDQVSNGSTQKLVLPLALHDACLKNKIDAVVHLPFWESHGHDAFPFHTKGRKCLQQLAPSRQLTHPALEKSLPSVLNFDAPSFVQKWVESRLRCFAGWTGRKLCLITRNGYTSVGKNWGHLWREEMPHGRQREGEECRDFMRLLHLRDPGWIFVVLEDRHFRGDDTVTDAKLNCFSYAELFAGAGGGPLPFSLVLKALLAVADIAIGVPSGPTHLAMARPGLPTIGIWTEHYPSWYDEPKAEAVHILSRNVWESSLAARPGSFCSQGSLSYQVRQVETRIIPGEAVLDAFEGLLGNRAA